MGVPPPLDLFTMARTFKLARTTDPATSHEAAAVVDAEGQRGKIMKALRGEWRDHQYEFTADGLDEYLGWRVTTAGRRLGELCKLGLVEPCGERLTRSNRPATVYRVVS